FVCLSRRDLLDVSREESAAASLGVPRRGDLLGRDVLGVLGSQLPRERARARRRRTPIRSRRARGTQRTAARSDTHGLLAGRPGGTRGRILSPAADAAGGAGRARP